jgi:hypothetical protein
VAYSKTYHNVFTPDEIQQLIKFFDDKESFPTERNIKNKNLEYHILDDFAYKLLNPKLTKLLGEHEFDTGTYKESSAPYGIHVDSRTMHDTITGLMSFAVGLPKQNVAVLIPLVEGPEFKTVTFDVFSDYNLSDKDLNTRTQEQINALNPDEFEHVRNFKILNRLPVDSIFEWKLGSVFVWPRNQQHMSTNFAKYNVTKKFLILFIR